MSENDKPHSTDGMEAAAGGPAGEPRPVGEDTEAQRSAEVSIEARLAELEGQIGDLTDRLLRAHADMDNMRKRAEREKLDAGKYAISKFALDIVGISDNFQRAVASLPPAAIEAEGTLKSVVDGLMMTERAFLQVLERHGVRRIDPMGEPFNPNMHQAVMEQENPAVPAGSVMQVFQPGFMIEERVLRPAMVVVARGGAKTPKPAEASRPAEAAATGAAEAGGESADGAETGAGSQGSSS